MSISLKRWASPTRFETRLTAGFTLVELLVSISILLLIISVVIFRFASFDSVILLRTLAYDIGLSIRSAQSYSLSALGYEDNFRLPYGVSFSPDSPNNDSYIFFRYLGSEAVPRYDGDYVDVYQLGRSFIISDVCVVVNSVEDCDISGLDVSFRRPEYTSIFYVPGYSGDLNDIDSGIIKVRSTRNEDITAVVEVTYTGQIEVSIE
jgi:prepilin-type N-terminal cleavage/methylation domain-containing protein